jgi:hypothetical protein
MQGGLDITGVQFANVNHHTNPHGNVVLDNMVEDDLLPDDEDEEEEEEDDILFE